MKRQEHLKKGHFTLASLEANGPFSTLQNLCTPPHVCALGVQEVGGALCLPSPADNPKRSRGAAVFALLGTLLCKPLSLCTDDPDTKRSHPQAMGVHSGHMGDGRTL